MKSLPVSFVARRLGTPATILGGLAVLHFTAAGGLPGLVADLRDCQARKAELAESEHETEDLDEQLVIANARTDIRLGLLAELVAKRRTLGEVCAEYRQFVGTDARFGRTLLAVTTGADDRERIANYLLTSLVRGQPVDAATRARLADEFRQEFGHAPDFVNSPPHCYPAESPSAGPAPLLLAPESAHCQ